MTKFFAFLLLVLLLCPQQPYPGGEYSTEEAYLAMKEELKGTIDGGSEIAGTVLEVAGSFITPDASDVVIPVAGAAGKRVFKLVRGGARIYAVAGRVTSLLSSNSAKLMATARARLNKGPDGPILIRIREKTTLTGQRGKLPPNSTREKLPDDRVKKKTTFLGQFCFVPGTLVDTQHGKRVIESLKAGDLVWAKDESTGETALKPIAQTFERVAPSTLALTFSNGETIETTIEHPFYVQDRGFVPAGLVALGNSIVTRAGPSLQVTAIEKHESAHRVYNFEVEDFHTYFVGKSSLWVHNEDCGTIAYGPSAGGKGREFATEKGAITLNDLADSPGDWVKFSKETLDKYQAGGGKVLFDLTHMEDIPGVLAKTGAHANHTTSHELRYIRDNWSRFSGTVTFYENGVVRGAPW